MKKSEKQKHSLMLWRKAYNKALSCSVLITQFNIIQTKVAYFGRQMLHGANNHKNNEMDSEKKQCNFIIMPDSLFRKIWDPIIIMIILYTATYDPYDCCFNLIDPGPGSFVYNINLLIDIIIGIDILVNFLTPLELEHDNLDTNLKNIAKSYLSGMFFVDFISCLPTNLFII